MTIELYCVVTSITVISIICVTRKYHILMLSYVRTQCNLTYLDPACKKSFLHYKPFVKGITTHHWISFTNVIDPSFSVFFFVRFFRLMIKKNYRSSTSLALCKGNPPDLWFSSQRFSTVEKSQGSNVIIRLAWETVCHFKRNDPREQGSCGQHRAHLGPGGPRWAPRWPHESCYQGTHGNAFFVSVPL